MAIVVNNRKRERANETNNQGIKQSKKDTTYLYKKKRKELKCER